MANSTPDTPDVSETKLAALKMDQLRTHARKLGIDGADELHKPELLAKVKDYHYAQAHGGKHRNGSGARSSTRGRPSATELSSMKLGELREHARELGIDGADELRKPELLAKVKDHHAADVKLGELRTHARELGIDGADELHKPELLAKVKDHHHAQAHSRKHRGRSGGGSSTASHPSATELSSMKLGELREHARKHGIDGADELHKPELLAKVKDHHYAQAHSGKHRPDTGSGSTDGAGGPSTANEDRGGHAAPDTPQANKTALSAASTGKPQDRPHSPDVHSPDVADEPDQPELRATVADAPTTAEDEHLSPLEEERPDLEHAGATTQAVTDTAGTTGTGGTTGPPPTAAAGDEGRVTAESTNDAGTRSPGRFDVGTQAHEPGPARLPEQVGNGQQQVSASVSIVEEVDVDRGSTTESVRGVADDDQAIVVKQPEVVRPAVVLPEELSVVDPRAVLEDRDVLDTKIRTAPATVGGETRTGGPEVDVDRAKVRGG